MENQLIYIGDAYLSRVELALTGLDYLDNTNTPELLSIDAFNRPIYELLYAAIVTGVEDYLQNRLHLEVFRSQKSLFRYVGKYNDLNKKSPRKIQLNGYPPSEEDIEVIEDSLYNRQVYHRLKIIKQYLEAITHLKLDSAANWEGLAKIIELRHTIIHHGGKTESKERISLSSYDVHQALKAAQSFIHDLEDYFQKNGLGYMYDIPETE